MEFPFGIPRLGGLLSAYPPYRSVVIETPGQNFPWAQTQILAYCAVHAVLDEESTVLRIIDVQTPGALNGHAKENDGARGAIHRVEERLFAFAPAGGCGGETDVHAAQLITEVMLQQMQRAAGIDFEPSDPVFGIGQL